MKLQDMHEHGYAFGFIAICNFCHGKGYGDPVYSAVRTFNENRERAPCTQCIRGFRFERIPIDALAIQFADIFIACLLYTSRCV